MSNPFASDDEVSVGSSPVTNPFAVTPPQTSPTAAAVAPINPFAVGAKSHSAAPVVQSTTTTSLAADQAPVSLPSSTSAPASLASDVSVPIRVVPTPSQASQPNKVVQAAQAAPPPKVRQAPLARNVPEKICLVIDISSEMNDTPFGPVGTRFSAAKNAIEVFLRTKQAVW